MNSQNIAIVVVFILVAVLLYQLYKSSRTQQASQIYQPRSTQEVNELIKNSLNIRPNYDANNDIYTGTHLQIDTTNLNNIVEYNPETETVTAETGTPIAKLIDYLAQYNVTLKSIPSNTEMTIGEAVANAAHGSNINCGTIADQTESFIVALDGGNIRKVEFDDPEFPAFNCNLGMYGIITMITLKCVPLEHTPVKKVTSDWNSIAPTLIDNVNNENVVSLQINPTTRIVKCNYPDPQSQPQHEIALPLDNLVAAINHLLPLIPADTTIAIDFTGADRNSWCSPAAGRDTAWLKLYNLHSSTLKLIEQEMFKFSGRPAWTTAKSLTPTLIRTLYGKAADYIAQHNKTFDPKKVFSNSFLEKLFN